MKRDLVQGIVIKGICHFCPCASACASGPKATISHLCSYQTTNMYRYLNLTQKYSSFLRFLLLPLSTSLEGVVQKASLMLKEQQKYAHKKHSFSIAQ